MLRIGGWQPLYPQNTPISLYDSEESHEPTSPCNYDRDSCCLGLLLSQPPYHASSWEDASLHGLSGDSCDGFFDDCSYSSNILDLFTFFSKTKLRLDLSLNKYRPVPSQWHDQGKQCNVVYAKLFNGGKTAHLLEVEITVIDLLTGTENLHWNMPTHDPNPSLTLKQLPKWGRAILSVAYIVPQERVWKLETAESSFLTNPHIYQNDQSYIVGIKVSHEPSHLDGWTFHLTLHSNGEATLGKVQRLKLKV